MSDITDLSYCLQLIEDNFENEKICETCADFLQDKSAPEIATAVLEQEALQGIMQALALWFKNGIIVPLYLKAIVAVLAKDDKEKHRAILRMVGGLETLVKIIKNFELEEDEEIFHAACTIFTHLFSRKSDYSTEFVAKEKLHEITPILEAHYVIKKPIYANQYLQMLTQLLFSEGPSAIRPAFDTIGKILVTFPTEDSADTILITSYKIMFNITDKSMYLFTVQC